MSAPVISSMSTDKAIYNVGDVITVTVGYTPGTSGGTGSTTVLTGTATDHTTGEVGAISVNFTVGGVLVTDPTTVAVSDSDGRVYTQKSDSGTLAVFTAKA